MSGVARAKGYFLPLQRLALLEKYVRSNHNVLSARRVLGHSWIDAGRMKRITRDGAVSDGIVAL